MATLEDLLKSNPPATSQIKKINGGNNTPISIDAAFDKIEAEVNKKDVEKTRGTLGNGGGGYAPGKPYSDKFK